MGGLSFYGALQRTDPFRVPHRLGEESRPDHRREQDLGFLIGRRAVRRAGLRQVIEKLRVQGFRPVPVGWRDLWRLIGRFDEREGKCKMKMDRFQHEATLRGTADQFLGGYSLQSVRWERL